MLFFSNLASAFTQGGMWMWLILALQIASIAIIIERAYVLFFKRTLGQRIFANTYEENIRKGQLKEAQETADKTKEENPLSRVALAGISSARNLGGQDEVRGKMDEVLLLENETIEQRTGFLSMLANVGTLTGLLGTILGMIEAFTAISAANPAEKATLLASGISKAMNTTAYGLIMAIPALIAYAVLSNRANQLVEDLSQGALKVYNWLSYAYDPLPARKPNKAVSRELSN